MIEVLDGFFAERSGEWYPKVVFDPHRPSPCQFGGVDAQGRVQWRPLRREGALRCTELEASTGYRLPASLHDFFGTHYAYPVECRSEHHFLMLDCGAWSDRQFQSREACLTEYLTARREQGLPASIPVATSCGDASLAYSVQLDTGAVHAERMTEPAAELVAGSLVEFVSGLRWSTTALAMQAE